VRGGEGGTGWGGKGEQLWGMEGRIGVGVRKGEGERGWETCSEKEGGGRMRMEAGRGVTRKGEGKGVRE